MGCRLTRFVCNTCVLSSLLLLHVVLSLGQPGTSHRRWVFGLEGTVVQSPAIGSDGTIYIGTGMFYDSPPSDCMYAIRPDGTLKWKRNLGRAIHSSVALDQEDNLYFLAGNAGTEDRMDAVVISLDSSGSPRWTSEAIGWLYPIQFTGFTPAIGADGTVYACGRVSLFALDTAGKTRWKFDFPLVDNTSGSGSGNAVGAQRSAPTIARDGTIYVNTAIGTYQQAEVQGGLFAINPAGTLKWRTYGMGGMAAPIIGDDGTIYQAVGCYWVPGAVDTADVAKESRLLALRDDGTVRWSVTTQLWIQASPSIGPDGTLYVGTSHHPLNVPAWFYAISADGQVKWKYDTYNDVKDMPPAQTNPPDIYNSPAIGLDGAIYFGNEIGILYSLLPDGSLRWMEEVWSVHDQGPALTSDGTLIVVTHSPFGMIALNTGSLGLADSPWPKFRQNNANTGMARAAGPSSAPERTAVPDAHELCQNYPNPCNPATTITYWLPKTSMVTLSVYDVLGRIVRVLVHEEKAAGVHEIKCDGRDLATGVYLYRLQAESFVKTRKLLVVK